ncbi:hypothetical protein IWW36_001085 [Coemansia brasiliensis]|uniref:Urease accessory protein UreD n=1 Tax=Coemansia brasiliensis TaxID=2650707 RepID=A0A9W8IG37_9FUNG|nr:hypothetical protein IWW36_001085 [Coemansia brasiliensis]
MPAAGEGRIDCRAIAGRIRQTVSSAYPLKIISPLASSTVSATSETTALLPSVAFILSYGGGIVHGDRILVHASVHPGCALLLLTQGSTKVFRQRNSTSKPSLGNDQTFQTMHLHVANNSLLCVLPDPVTCFKGARYNQRQAVTIQKGGSLILLDWMTSGRMSRGERWEFEKYFSVNVVRLEDGELAIRDALLLEQEQLAEKLVDVDAFAYLIILGPAVEFIASSLLEKHQDERIRPARSTSIQPLVKWSISPISHKQIQGVTVRAACKRTDELKLWIKSHLEPLQHIIGDSAWSMYLNN